MFFIELMAARFDIFGEMDHNDLESYDPALDLVRRTTISQSSSDSSVDEKTGTSHLYNIRKYEANQSTVAVIDRQGIESGNGLDVHGHNYSDRPEAQPEAAAARAVSSVPDVSYPPGNQDHLAHSRTHKESAEYFAAQMTAIFILEFGVIFHSIFIGLTLAVAGEEFNVLYIVLVFHQTFEGLGLGSRLATAQWPRSKRWMPWILGAAYGVTTPIAIAIGLGVRESFSSSSNTTMIVNGVFDSISAGILLYTGLVELMAHEFMFNPEMKKASIWMMLSAFGCMCVGAGLMALLGKWA